MSVLGGIDAHGSPFELVTHAGERARVVALRGREQVSKLFRFDVEVVLGPHPSELLGERASLLLRSEDGPPRLVHGMIERVSRAERTDAGVRATVRLAPRLSRLARRRTRRVFQEQTTLEIAARVLAEWGLPMRALSLRPLPKRPYSVQYDESDLAYLERLFAEEGLFFGFEHTLDPQVGEALLVADLPSELAHVDGLPRLVHDAAATGAASRVAEHVAFDVSRRARLAPEGARVRGYDHRRPRLVLEDGLDAESRETLDEDEGSYEDDLPPRPARVRLEAARRASDEVRASTFCARLEVLRRVALDAEHGGLDLVVTRVEHEGYGGEVVPAGKVRYQNRVRLSPSTLAPRPARVPARPRQTSETAVIVGPPGSEVHTDELGRVKVRFHWDREARGDDTSSCWLRVLTPWAGQGWGTSFTPRVGMEVLVTLVAGDVDRPVCAGALSNAVMPPPFAGTTSGVRTRSTPDGQAGNELSFDDSAGAERVTLVASRDLVEEVASARHTTVGGDRTARVRGTDSLAVGEARHVEIGAERRAVVGGDDELVVKGARRLVVGGDLGVSVRGAERVSIEQGSAVVVRGDASFVVGDPEAEACRHEHVYGSYGLGVAGPLELTSREGITLVCGESRILLLPDKIVLASPALELVGADELSVGRADGPTLRLGDEAELTTKALRIFTDAGALELDRDFKVKGGKIKLGYDPSKPEHQADEAEPETEPVELLMSNADLEPLCGCDYHVLVGSLRIEGKTNGEGKLKADVPKGTKAIVVRIWERDYPTGPALTYSVALGPPPPPAVEGAKVRLRNLGYYHGALDDLEDPPFSAALREFQEDHRDSHDLTPSGKLDAPTEAALEDIHGS